MTAGGAGLGVPGAATGGGSGSRRALGTCTAARLVNIVTWNQREKMQSADGSSLVRRKGSGFEDCQICGLLSRCDKRHFPVDCPLYRKLPVQHRVSLLEAAGICKKCLSHKNRDDRGAEHCEGRHGEDHWMCRDFSGPGRETGYRGGYFRWSSRSLAGWFTDAGL